MKVASHRGTNTNVYDLLIAIFTYIGIMIGRIEIPTAILEFLTTRRAR